MSGTSPGAIPLAAAWSSEPVGFVVVLAILVLLAAWIVVASRLFGQLRSRRRRGEQVREIAGAIEDLRSAKTRRRIELEPHSPMAPVADAVNGLGQWLQVRLNEAAATSERLELVMSAYPDSAIIGTDMDHDIRSFSSGAERMLGWREDQARARPSSILFEDSAYKEFLSRLVRPSGRGRGARVRTTLKREDGTTFPASVTVCQLHGPREEPVGMLLIVQDVTRQVLLETELSRSGERYRRLFEGMPQGVAIVREGRLVYVNEALGELCELPGERLIGSALRDRIDTRDVLAIEERIARLGPEPGATDEMACTIVGAESRRSEVRLFATSVEYERESATLLLVRDETEIRRIEAEAQRRESRFDAALEAVSDGLLVLDDGPDGGRINMANRAFLETFDLSREELLDLPVAHLAAGLRERDDGAAALGELLAGEGLEAPSRRIRIRGESPKDLQVTLAPLLDRDGRGRGRILVCRDLATERESARKLQESAEELQLSKMLLEKAREELRELSEIRGFSRDDRKPPIPADPEPAEFDLRTLIEETVAELRKDMESRGIHFTLEMPGDVVTIRADRGEILRVFVQLLSNAVTFNRRGGSIQVRVRREGTARVAVDVDDTGVGAARAAIDRIFEKRRGQTDVSRRSEGPGFGVADVREILDRHGCRLDVAVVQDPGTRYSFTLPATVGPRRKALRRDAPRNPSLKPRFRVIRRRSSNL